MIHDDTQKGAPLVMFSDTKANIEALSSPTEGSTAYATDTNLFGFYDGSVWVWSSSADTTAYGGNLIKNSPGQIVTDAAEPQWWDDVTNATITDEDASGETIPEKTERVFKVVTTADDVYGYQTFTFSDESLLDAGQTVVSLGCWVYCATASKASIGLYGTNLGLQESSQHSGGSSWEWLTVEGETIHASDTSIEVRLIVDTGTAYFTMPMLSVGSVTKSWVTREWRYVPQETNILVDANPTGDVAWSDDDATADTNPLAVAINLKLHIAEVDGTNGSWLGCSHASALVASDTTVCMCRRMVAGSGQLANTMNMVMLDDAQTYRYTIDEMDADSDVDATIRTTGYWMWA